LRTSVPQIDDELAESLRVLEELEARLPAIRTQAAQVQLIMIRVGKRYDSLQSACHSPGPQCLTLLFLLTKLLFTRQKHSWRTFDG